MESFTGDAEDNSEELTGKKKSKLKSLKTRLFGKKKEEGERERDLSQSASNIPEGDVLGSDEDLVCGRGTLGSRALSHDSIFLAELSSTGPVSSRVLSQENVHGKIKALQEKLQQQNMRLGPPPLVLPIKRQEDLGGSSEDDGLPHSPPEMCQGEAPLRGASYKFSIPPRNQSSLIGTGTGSEEEVQASSLSSSRPLSPITRPLPARSMHPIPSLQSTPPSIVSPPTEAPTVDFSSPAQFTPCLDSSAARHRMSVKPRNQRASAKTRRLTTNETRPRSESFTNFERPLSDKDDLEGITAGKEKVRLRSYSTQVLGAGKGVLTTSPATPGLPLKTPELTSLRSAPMMAQSALRSSSPTLTLSHQPSPQGQAPSRVSESSTGPTTLQPPGAKPQTPVEPASAKQPQPPHTPSRPDLRERKEGSGATPSSQALTPNTVEPKAPALAPAKREPETLQSPINLKHPKKEPVVSAGPSTGLSAVGALQTSSLKGGSQDVAGPGQDNKTGGLKRVLLGSGAGSGSLKFSVNSSSVEQERPRTGSFLGLMEQAGAGLKKEDKEQDVEMRTAPSNVNQSRQQQQAREQEGVKLREQPLDPSRGGGGGKATVGTATEGEAKPSVPLQNPVAPWGRRDTLQKDQSESLPRVTAMDTGALEGEELEEESREGVEEAMEATEEDAGKEEDAKTAFGVKLRSTSLSLKCRSETKAADLSEARVGRNMAEVDGTVPPPAPFTPGSKTLGTDERVSLSPRKAPTHTSTAAVTLSSRMGSLRQTDPRSSAHSPPSSADVQKTPPAAGASVEAPPPASAQKESQSPSAAPQSPSAAPQSTSAAPQSTSAAPQSTPAASQADPQAAGTEVSWMSLALEKTRNLQQLFTSRLPREFPGMQQPTPRPQTQAQNQTQAQTPTQTQNQNQTQAQNQIQTQAQAQTPTQTQNQNQTQAQNQIQTQAQAQTPTQTQNQTQAQIRTHTQNQTRAQTQLRTHALTHSQIQKVAQPQAQTVTQAKNAAQPLSATQPPAETARVTAGSLATSHPLTAKQSQGPRANQSETETLGQPKTTTQTTKPPPTETTKPLAKETTKPLATQTTKPLPTQTTKPLPTETTKPLAAQTTKPLVTQTTKPLATQSTKPLATQTTNQTYPAKLSQPEANQGNSRSAQPSTKPETLAQVPPRVTQVTQQPSQRTTQPLLRSLPQARGETSPWPPLSSSPKSSPSQPPWSSRGLHSTPQPKPTTPTQGSTIAPALTPAPAPAPSPVPTPSPAPVPAPALGRGERPGSQKGRGEVVTESERLPFRPGKIGKRAAAFQEKEWTPPAGTKGELKKTPMESTPTPKTTGRPEARPESSPTKVPGRLTDREDKCFGKNVHSSSLPSSSPTSSSPLQNTPNSGQPSWMELAKRKSMAWSDKTMD